MRSATGYHRVLSTRRAATIVRRGPDTRCSVGGSLLLIRVLDRVDAATETGEITVEDVAMVYKSDKGKVTIQQTADATAGRGAVQGGGLGLLVGIFAAPLVPAVAVGAGIGAPVGKARDRRRG
jgi:hypothetical protein